MGSSGTGSFSDYPGSRGGRPGAGGGGGAGGGKADDQDKCAQAISGLALDEVGLAEYYTKHNKVPAVGTKIRVRKKLVGKRIAVETTTGEVIGYVPTAKNYLLACMEQGWQYQGKVADASAGKLPKIKVDLVAAK